MMIVRSGRKKERRGESETRKNHFFAKNSSSDLLVKHDLNLIGYELLNAYLNVRNRCVVYMMAWVRWRRWKVVIRRRYHPRRYGILLV